MNMTVRMNLFLAAGLAAHILLAFFPLGIVYLLIIVLYRSLIPAVAVVMAGCSIYTFPKVKDGKEINLIFLFLGALGGMAALAVNRECEYKEEVYIGFSLMLWLFIIYPAAVFCFLRYTNIWWAPSV